MAPPNARVWETREHFDRWTFGVEGRGPQMTFYDVHNTLGAAPAAAR